MTLCNGCLWMMHASPRVALTALCAHAAVCARRDATACVPLALDMRYGFLTYLNGTFFIRRVGQHDHAFTDAIGPCDTDPTVREMLLCEQGETETTCYAVCAVWRMSVLLCTLHPAFSLAAWNLQTGCSSGRKRALGHRRPPRVRLCLRVVLAGLLGLGAHLGLGMLVRVAGGLGARQAGLGR